jgi:hypothetical protein
MANHGGIACQIAYRDITLYQRYPYRHVFPIPCV